MEAFTELRSLAASLPRDNIDTDAIIPARFLSTIERTGLGKGLFIDLRRDENGEPNDFVLNRAPFDSAKILVAGQNFGCGSSREHAPWALMDSGIRCVIAGSFADIFHNNCLMNGLLPVTIPDAARLERYHRLAEAEAEFFVSLESRTIEVDGESESFDIDAGRRAALLAGLDAIGETLQLESEIAAFEERRARTQPWLAREGRGA
ncbi:MAG: 3-isopropylmalate dehydratase small subunit [Alphaproteobacteria bacterium]|nr:3-isopropylmalate dehydratase small subunit [Alphaproteobacteria bacterium]